jgi:hypothetical protein
MSTCQICGRTIKANTGTIALHGYTRPGDGWQTAPCYGARFQPYEVSCSAIQPAIDIITAFIAERKAYQADFLETPPASYTVKNRYPLSGNKEVLKPENFNPSQSVSFRDEYAMAYSHEKSQLITAIKYAEIDLIYLQKRLSDWKPVPTRLGEPA